MMTISVGRKGAGILAALLALTCATPSIAGPYEDGMDAYKKKNYVLAMKLWRPLAQDDDVRAQAGVAKLYFAGLGVGKDLREAVYWGEKAAKRGEPRAQFVMACLYRDGEGVTKDLARAVELFQKAADQNHAWAQYSLGLMYNLGEGVPHDRIMAYKWLSLAGLDREGEDVDVVGPASFVLDKVASKMTPEQIAEAKRRVREWKPVQPG